MRFAVGFLWVCLLMTLRTFVENTQISIVMGALQCDLNFESF